MWRWRAVVYFLFLWFGPSVPRKILPTPDLLVNFVRDSLVDINRDFNKTDEIRQNSRMSAGFEIGFVLKSMEECYRRMVDIYNSTITTDLNGWDAKTTDNIVFLRNVEMLFWMLDHLTNMLHEIEKKYKVKIAGMFDEHEVWTIKPPRTTKRRKYTYTPGAFSSSTRKPTMSWWPLEYGWEMSYEWR